MKKQTIAVIGYTGMVGNTTFNWFTKQGYQMMGLTSSKKTHSWDQINREADWIFVAVPTPFNWKTKQTNTQILEKTLGRISPGKKVIHKCTVPPGSTEEMQKKFPTIKLLFNPEFLSETTCEKDFEYPDRQIIGYTDHSYSIAIEALNLLPESPYGVIMKATEAEIVKLINNIHGSMMVIFSNFFYDISQKFKDLNFERIKNASSASKWVGSPMGRMYWDVFHGGFRGYGGSCFPKDVNMLIKWCKDNNLAHELLKATREANIRILKTQGMTEEDAERRKSISEKTMKNKK